jgi:ATP-dependent RNA/DNA helicase IGHMBP2
VISVIVDSKSELEHVLSTLKIEQDEDRVQYKEKVLKFSLSERKKMGVSWYPIVIKESYYGLGERLILEIERPANTDVSHQFQTGKVASLFSNYHNDGPDNPAISGVVMSARPNSLKLTLFVDELPDWARDGKLGLDLLFDETSYKEMEIAVNKVIKSKNNRLAQLREILLGYEPAKYNSLKEKVKIDKLNDSQNRSLNNILEAEDVSIIHGPPGTGKTTTLVKAIQEVLRDEKQVLVCAPSNTAVDLLTEKLSEAGLNVVRFGNPSRVSENLLALTVDAKVAAHKDFKQIKELKKRAAEFKNMGHKYKRNFGREERSQRKMIFDEAKKLDLEAGKIESYITDDIIGKAQVITCTLIGSSNYLIRDRQYSTVFIDEPAQALEPACWVPITRADKVVFAGDHCQLPPTVKSLKAGKEGLNITLFEKCILRQKADVMLETQYRMNEQIMNFPNKEFYKGLLKADESVRNHLLSGKNEMLMKPLEFIDTAGCSYQESLDKETLSTFNKEEGSLLLKHLSLLLEHIKNEGLDSPDFRIGIISPYKAQINLLKTLIIDNKTFQRFKSHISVNTVDGFQGQERDVIYISLVRSNDTGDIGFLSDIRRMNVAITRAKKKLVVIGDSSTLSQHPFYNDFFKYVESVDAYKSAWEYVD